MADNKIEIYQGNSDTIFCAITDSSSLTMDLTGYTGTITVKKNVGSTAIIQKIHSNKNDSEGAIWFEILTTETDITAGDYMYDITIDNSTNIHTPVQDRFRIIDSVRY